MRVWTEFMDSVEGKSPAAESNTIVLVTRQGRFTIKEADNGALEINGSGPHDARNYSTSFAVLPHSGNDVTVGFARRTDANGGIDESAK